MTNPWLQLIQTSNTAQYNFICLPFAGGYAEYFLPWRAHLPPEVQLCPVQLPGRSYRWQEPVETNMQQLLTAMIPMLSPLLQSKPYVLFGHSMGGYIAYELCKLLAEKGLPLPTLLVVSSIPAPKYWLSRRSLSQLTEEEFFDFFIRLGGFHSELLKHTTFIKMQMSLLRNDILLCESCGYAGQAGFPFPILSMGGKEDPYVMIKSMADWGLETVSDFSLHEFSGQHFYLNDHLQSVLGLIKQRIFSYDYVQ